MSSRVRATSRAICSTSEAHAVEAQRVAQPGGEGQADLLAVEVAGRSPGRTPPPAGSAPANVGLVPMLMAAGSCSAAADQPAGVDAVGGHGAPGQRLQVGGRVAELAAALVAAHDDPLDPVLAPEDPGGAPRRRPPARRTGRTSRTRSSPSLPSSGDPLDARSRTGGRRRSARRRPRRPWRRSGSSPRRRPPRRAGARRAPRGRSASGESRLNSCGERQHAHHVDAELLEQVGAVALAGEHRRVRARPHDLARVRVEGEHHAGHAERARPWRPPGRRSAGGRGAPRRRRRWSRRTVPSRTARSSPPPALHVPTLPDGARRGRSGRREDHPWPGGAVPVLDEGDAAAVRRERPDRAGERRWAAARRPCASSTASSAARSRRGKDAATASSSAQHRGVARPRRSPAPPGVRARSRPNGPDPGAAQRGEVRAHPERRAEVAGQRADVRARSDTVQGTSTSSPRRASTVEPRHDDRAGGELDLLAGAHPGVGAHAADLDRRHRGRHLLDRTGQRGDAPGRAARR